MQNNTALEAREREQELIHELQLLEIEREELRALVQALVSSALVALSILALYLVLR